MHKRKIIITTIITVAIITLHNQFDVLANNKKATNTVFTNASNNPQKIIGFNNCAGCHLREVQVWKKTPHFKSFTKMHRNKKAKQIFRNLGLKGSIKRNRLCANCHYTEKPKGKSLKAISGVSCESCHGGAKDWIHVHNVPGNKVKRRAKAKKLGMNNPHDLYSVARKCYQCHFVPNEALVNKGHHPNSNFEFVSWSQGMIRHTFISRGNRPTPRPRLRMMYITGAMLELENSLRGLAKAKNANGKYAKIMKIRAKKAVGRLIKIKSKIKVLEIQKLFKVLRGIRLNPKYAEQLLAKAKQIAVLNKVFNKKYKGGKFVAIDSLLPPSKTYKK